MNRNLLKLNIYQSEEVNASTNRCHANESKQLIMPAETLIQDVFENINYYPEGLLQNLILAASDFYKIDPDFVISTNGSDEGLDLIIRTLCNPQDKVVLLKPTFSMYKQYSIAFGLELFEFQLNQSFEFNIIDFIKYCQEISPRIIFIPNPLAPTGGIIKTEDLQKLITNLPNTIIIIDEAYIEFSNQQSMLALITKYKNLIVTRTLSKFFGLAGMRLGFVFSHFKKDLLKIKSPYNINSVSCKVGINLFNNITDSIINSRHEANLLEKEKLILWLESFQEVKKVYPSYTNFVFIELESEASRFAKKLLHEYNMIIKTFADLPKFIRISV